MRKWIASNFLGRNTSVQSKKTELMDVMIDQNAYGQLCLSKLTELLLLIKRDVPYYSNFMSSHSIGEFDIRSNPKAVLNQLPVVDKNEISKNRSLFTSLRKDEYQYAINRTGGSTGVPFEVLQDSHFHYYNEAVFQYSQVMKSIELGDSEMILWGSTKDTFAGSKGLKAHLRDFLYNRATINTFSISNSDLEAFVNRIRKWKPKMIRAYAQSIHELAKYMIANDNCIQYAGVIHTGAGTLHDFMRRDISKAFGTNDIFNHYGSRELGSIATECKVHSGLHVFGTHQYVELLNSNNVECKPGELGKIVVTSLNNRVMPLVRYSIGDMATWHSGSCSCGLAGRLLESVSGRQSEMVILGNGNRIVPTYFIHSIGVDFNNGDVLKFQVVQKGIDYFVVKMVTSSGRPLSKERVEFLKTLLAKKIGEATVEVQWVDDIPLTQSGKFNYVISEIV